MPLPQFLALILAVIALAGLTLWTVNALALPVGMVSLGFVVGALAVRALAWR